jgi:hypothetical protein
MRKSPGRGGSGFHFGTTSDNKIPLTRDEGSIWSGKVRSDHAVDPRLTRPHSRGFENPQRDYGPPDQINSVGHINAPQAVKPKWAPGQGYTRQPDRGVIASPGRARASSASEYTEGANYYGGPPRRQR